MKNGISESCNEKERKNKKIYLRLSLFLSSQSIIFKFFSSVQLDQLVRDGRRRQHAQVGEEQRDELWSEKSFFFFSGRKREVSFLFTLFSSSFSSSKERKNFNDNLLGGV